MEKFAGKPFAIIGVNSDKDLEKLKPRLAEEKITWRSFTCGPEATTGPIPTKWNVSGWPTMVVIDQEGVIRERWLGSPGEKVIDDTLTELVEKAASAK